MRQQEELVQLNANTLIGVTLATRLTIQKIVSSPM
jgi:hypothetical protein